MLSTMRGERKIRNRETKRKPWKQIVEDSIRKEREGERLLLRSFFTIATENQLF